MTWEYQVVPVSKGIGGGGIKLDDLESNLAAAGRDGWELVHVMQDASVLGRKDGHIMLFKRPAA
jgi:hypothetical protein